MNNAKYGKIGIAILFIALAVFSVISEGFSRGAFIMFSILGFCFLLVIGFVSLFGMGKPKKEALTPGQGSIVVDSKFKFSRAVKLFIIIFILLIVVFALMGDSPNN